MQAWFAARQWELLFVVAMVYEWPPWWLWIAGALLVLAGTLAFRWRMGLAGRILAAALVMLAVALLVLTVGAVLLAPDLVDVYLDGALQRAGLRILTDLLLGVSAGLMLLGAWSLWRRSSAA